jgi:aminoglycoside phosphotransferase (APT) family kinase protein
MSELIDAASPIRPGEELDLAKLEAYLKQTFGPFDGTLAVEQFRRGHSNLSYLVRMGDREMVLRRPPFGSKVKTAHDMGREFTVLRHLSPVYPAAPRTLAYCEDESVLGAKFYLMERVKGVILRGQKPRDLDVPPEKVRQCCLAFVKNLADLHRIDFKAVGLDELHRPGQYMSRQVLGWADRYAGSKTDDIPDIDATIEWLKGRIPEDTDAVLIHNDYKFDNVVLDPNELTRIIGVLDWEMATIGDPLMDLGNSLAYWVEADDDPIARTMRRQPTHLRGMLTRREVVDYYCERTGVRPDDWTFYEVCGLFRLSAIAQQIYYRYHHGQSRNPAFRHFWFFVHYLHHRCRRAIARSRRE